MGLLEVAVEMLEVVEARIQGDGLDRHGCLLRIEAGALEATRCDVLLNRATLLYLKAAGEIVLVQANDLRELSNQQGCLGFAVNFFLDRLR